VGFACDGTAAEIDPSGRLILWILQYIGNLRGKESQHDTPLWELEMSGRLHHRRRCLTIFLSGFQYDCDEKPREKNFSHGSMSGRRQANGFQSSRLFVLDADRENFVLIGQN
jgi:hypothetical protein